MAITGHEAVLTMVSCPAVATVAGEGAVMLLAGAATLARRLVTWPGCHLAHITTAGHVPGGALALTRDTLGPHTGAIMVTITPGSTVTGVGHLLVNI